MEPARSIVGSAGYGCGGDGGMPDDLGPDLRQAVGATLGAAILVGSIVVEPFVAKATRFRVPIACGCRTYQCAARFGILVHSRSPQARWRRWPGCCSHALGASSWWWVVISLLAVAPVAVLAVDGRSKIVLAPAAKAGSASRCGVCTGLRGLHLRPDDASYQVMMWLPYLQRAGLRFIIVARNAVHCSARGAKRCPRRRGPRYR